MWWVSNCYDVWLLNLLNRSRIIYHMILSNVDTLERRLLVQLNFKKGGSHWRMIDCVIMKEHW